MKYKCPKKITIGSVIFKIKYNKGKGDLDAHFSYQGDDEHPYPHIYFGGRGGDEFLEVVIRELKEIIQIEQDVRFYSGDDGSLVFSYSQAEHTDLCARLAGLLREFIK
jgi:hypothetical protein